METEQSQIQTQLLPDTWEQFFEKCKPEILILQYWQVVYIEDSLSKKRITFREMRDKYGTINHKKYGICEAPVLYFFEYLNYFNTLSNINKPLPAVAIKQLSLILYSKYYYFYLSDLKLILEGLLEGKYGKFYGSVDSVLISSAFKEYSDKRMQKQYELKNK